MQDDPDHVVLLSGQDYPIKPNAYIEDFLAAGSESSFFMHFPLPTANWSHGGMRRFCDWHFRYRRLHLRLPLRRRLTSPPLRPTLKQAGEPARRGLRLVAFLTRPPETP